MAAFDEFKKRVFELIDQGCSLDKAFAQALQEYEGLADSADQVLELKQKIEWELKKRQNPS